LALVYGDMDLSAAAKVCTCFLFWTCRSGHVQIRHCQTGAHTQINT